MAKIMRSLRKSLHQLVRGSIAGLPRAWRFAIYRSFVDCDSHPDSRLELKIAETREELEACFKLLHDAYVDSGFMKPDPSGLRVTIYHALPTTTTLCAKFDGEVVGTLSLIRESALGFPLQQIFDLSKVRGKGGQIAEASALAVHPRFRRTGGAVMFPLMKFMREYCAAFFDTRHLVIAVNPNRIEMYESLMFFDRLTANAVENYDFANGAPAVGATLDLQAAPTILERCYGEKKPRKNLYHYFFELNLPNIQMPTRRYYTTNDPVLTPELLDYFFNQRTQGFAQLDEHKKALLHSIYDLPEYRNVLPLLKAPQSRGEKRSHRRFSVLCPGRLTLLGENDHKDQIKIEVIEVSNHGFQARSERPLPLGGWHDAVIRLGRDEVSYVKVHPEHGRADGARSFYGFRLGEPDLIWRKFVAALDGGQTHGDLEQASRFLAA